MKQLFVIILILLFIGAGSLPSLGGNANTMTDKKPTVGEINIFGLFPHVVGDMILYLSLSPLGWRTIYYDYFSGNLGLWIRGTYPLSIPPQAYFVYYPSNDIWRVVYVPFYFKSLSTDVDGEIIEEWWKFDDSEPWVMTDTPWYIYTEPGYHNVSLRVIDNDGLNTTSTFGVFVHPTTPTFQGLQGVNNITIVGLHVLGSHENYNWTDFRNVGSGDCILPIAGHPQIGDIITNCSGLIILQYVPNGVISGYWKF
jgi:PKD repeat protein